MMRDTTVIFAQTPLLKSQLEELKRLSGTAATKDALPAAANRYLSCPLIRGRSEVEESEEGGGERGKMVKEMTHCHEPNLFSCSALTNLCTRLLLWSKTQPSCG